MIATSRFMGLVLCFSIGVPKSTEGADVSLDGPIMEPVLQLCAVADLDRHKDLVATAKRQQELEEAAKSKWSHVVYDAQIKIKRVAKWVPVEDQETEKFATERNWLTRRAAPSGAREAPLEVLVVVSKYDVTSADLKEAFVVADERGRPAIAFSLTTTGARRMARLTGENLPHEANFVHLAIIVSNAIYSAPRSQSVISERGIIEGNFTAEEAERIATVIMADVPLKQR